MDNLAVSLELNISLRKRLEDVINTPDFTIALQNMADQRPPVLPNKYLSEFITFIID